MTEVFHNDQDIAVVGADWLDRLKDVARASTMRRARLCLHRGPHELVHEMIIVLLGDALFRPHRHVNKTESFHIIEGELYVLLFDDRGVPQRAIHMSASGRGQPFYYRLSASTWHAVLPVSEIVVMHETTNGPFVPGDALLAAWAPPEGDALRRFLSASLARCLAAQAEAPGA